MVGGRRVMVGERRVMGGGKGDGWREEGDGGRVKSDVGRKGYSKTAERESSNIYCQSSEGGERLTRNKSLLGWGCLVSPQ